MPTDPPPQAHQDHLAERKTSHPHLYCGGAQLSQSRDSCSVPPRDQFQRHRCDQRQSETGQDDHSAHRPITAWPGSMPKRPRATRKTRRPAPDSAPGVDPPTSTTLGTRVWTRRSGPLPRPPRTALLAPATTRRAARASDEPDAISLKLTAPEARHIQSVGR